MLFGSKTKYGRSGGCLGLKRSPARLGPIPDRSVTTLTLGLGAL